MEAKLTPQTQRQLTAFQEAMMQIIVWVNDTLTPVLQQLIARLWPLIQCREMARIVDGDIEPIVLREIDWE